MRAAKARRRLAEAAGVDNDGAGWMPHDEARATIERCAAEYVTERAALEQGNETHGGQTA